MEPSAKYGDSQLSLCSPNIRWVISFENMNIEKLFFFLHMTKHILDSEIFIYWPRFHSLTHIITLLPLSRLHFMLSFASFFLPPS
jgi:hypothetical protein